MKKMGSNKILGIIKARKRKENTKTKKCHLYLLGNWNVQ